MNIYTLERYTKGNGKKFKNLIFNESDQFGVEKGIKYLKKSGICIDPFGSGEPKNKILV